MSDQKPDPQSDQHDAATRASSPASSPDSSRSNEDVPTAPISDSGRRPATDSNDANGLPSRLGQYELLDQLGSGGMGAVYKAYHVKLKKLVAIKFIRNERDADPRALQRFYKEMEAIGRVSHPNILQATDANDVKGVHFIVTEYIDGFDLSEAVRLTGPLSIPNACEVAWQASIALQHAHDCGLIHRDVKPSNLMLNRSGQIKLLDLGVAKLRVESDTPKTGDTTGENQVMGTPEYMAPEQFSTPADVDGRADVYALGCTLYCLLAGRPPFRGADYPTVYRLLHAQAYDPPSLELLGEVPPQLRELAGRMLAKDRNHRPKTAGEVARELEPFSRGSQLLELLETLQIRAEAAGRSAACGAAAGGKAANAAGFVNQTTLPLGSPAAAQTKTQHGWASGSWLSTLYNAAGARPPLSWSAWSAALVATSLSHLSALAPVALTVCLVLYWNRMHSIASSYADNSDESYRVSPLGRGWSVFFSGFALALGYLFASMFLAGWHFETAQFGLGPAILLAMTVAMWMAFSVVRQWWTVAYWLAAGVGVPAVGFLSLWAFSQQGAVGMDADLGWSAKFSRLFFAMLSASLFEASVHRRWLRDGGFWEWLFAVTEIGVLCALIAAWLPPVSIDGAPTDLAVIASLGGLILLFGTHLARARGQIRQDLIWFRSTVLDRTDNIAMPFGLFAGCALAPTLCLVSFAWTPAWTGCFALSLLAMAAYRLAIRFRI